MPRDDQPTVTVRATSRRRWVLPAVLVILWLAVGGPLGSFQGQLAGVAENDNASFLPATAESTKVNEIQPRFAEAAIIPAIVVYERESGITPEDISAAEDDVAQISELNGLVGAISPPIPSEDGQALQVIIPLDANLGDELSTIVTDIREIVADGDIDFVSVTGPGGIIADFGEAFGDIDGFLVIVTALVVAFILVLVYRSPVLPVVVLVGAALALGVSAVVVYGLVKAEVITLNGQSQGILLILVFGASTDYALLLVSRFREELHHSQDKYDAIRKALRGALAPIVASAVTVILGVLCLLLSDLNSIRGLGPVSAIGIAASLLVQLTYLPAVLTLLGRGAFWPRRPRRDDTTSGERGIWVKVAGLVQTHPRRVWVTTSLLLLVAASFVFQLRVGGASQTDIFLTEVDSVAGQEALGRHFPAGAGSPAVIIGAADDVDDLVAAAESVESVDSVAVTTQAPPGAPASVPGPPDGEPKVVDGLVEINAVLNVSADGEVGYQAIRELREVVGEVGDGSALVGGFTALNLDTQDTSERDLTLIIPIVLLVVFVVLALLLRAIVAPLVLIATVVLSYLATLGVAELVFDHIFGWPPADPAVPLFGFVFLVALGIDYNIFLMTRVREESLKRGTRPGILAGLRVTGGVITSAGVVLAATFAALGVIPVLFLAQIAFVVAFGVLLDTTVVRSLLVPALTHDIGRAIWWPSTLSRADKS
ncbi:MAG: efflux RND transporter permease subunit [Actinomycetota bacterium]|nr:efflux RND transporter permease subunit [Actinomycetota bacterium]